MRAWRARVEPARAEPAPQPSARSSPEHSDRHAAVPPPNKSQKQKIVTVRVCAVGEARWSGTDLMAALEALGLAYGRYQVFHRNHTDGRSIFCVASLVEPGTFDLPTWRTGVSRRHPVRRASRPPRADRDRGRPFRHGARARGEFTGTMQDANGMPFSPQRAAALLEDVVRFPGAACLSLDVHAAAADQPKKRRRRARRS